MGLTPTVDRRASENYIWTRNPFGLAKPPDWFLDELYAYDAMLRIFASLNEGVYRIMRKMSSGQPWTQFIATKPDTGIAIQHRLYPVISVIPQTILGFSWARVLMEVMERDQQQFASANEVANHVEAHEARQEQRTLAAEGAEIDARSGDMYRAYKTMNGERVSLAYNKPDGARLSVPGRPRRASYRPQNAGAGAFFTGRARVPVSDTVRRPPAGAYR